MSAFERGDRTFLIGGQSDAAGFEVLPKRWIIERTFAWISRCRRLGTAIAFVRLAMIRIVVRRLARNASAWI